VKKALTNAGLFEAAIMPMERKGKLPYKPMRPSGWMIRKILKEMEGLGASNNRRVRAVAEYVEQLRTVDANKIQIPAEIIKNPQPLVRMPIFVKDQIVADGLIDELTQKGVYVGKWYRPALFPGVDDVKIYNYEPESLPTSEDLVARVVNLPTDVNVAEAKKIAKIVVETLA
jgi:dTDP-4-amino-4,6-dideoxygalactose transaminase